MLYLSLQLAVLTLPGWLLLRLLGIGENRCLLSVSLSYALFVFLAAAARLLDLTAETFLTTWSIAVLLLAAAALPAFRRSAKPPKPDRKFLAGAAFVVLAYLAYRCWAGPYTEIPADFYRHLEYAQQQARWLEQGVLGPRLSLGQLFSQQGQIWYTLFALLTRLSGGKIAATFSMAMLANGTLFLLAVYGFAWHLAGRFGLDGRQQLTAALLGALFVAIHMGINVFAYLRYYSMAPTMLNFILFFSGIVAVDHLLEKSGRAWKWSAILAVCTTAAALVHTQEALYIAVLGTLMLAWSGVRELRSRLRSRPASQWPRLLLADSRLLLLLGILSLAMAAEFWAYTHLERAPLAQGKVITLSPAHPLLNRLPVLNPEFQFARVLTPWGGLVYLLFLLNFRRFAPHPYFVAGMALPLFTVFNPLFVDLFLRFDNAHTLWRLTYAIPIHFAGAMLAVHYARRIRVDKRLPARGEALIALTLLFLLLFPLRIGNWQNPYARATLAPVPAANDHRLWQDAVEELNRLPGRRPVLTDPVTGYVVSALTGRRTYHYKFFPTAAYREKWTALEAGDLTGLRNHLLLVNQRDGPPSRTGAIARHWPADILKVSRSYPPGLPERIRRSPGHFRPLWQGDGISLYRIAP